MGRRIAINGISGSGKSTVARIAAERLGVRWIELDALHHGPNWSEPSAEEFRARVRAELEGSEGWVVDGGYRAKLGDLVLARADTFVWLDLPLAVCLRRLWRRTAHRIRDDVELWAGNTESWRTALVGRESLFVWTIRKHFDYRRSLPPIGAGNPELEFVHLRSQAEIDAWLESLSVAGAAAP
jgi:adenylate kinase family enzyme